MTRHNVSKNFLFRNSGMLGGFGSLSCVVGVKSATVELSLCTLPPSCVSKKIIFGMEAGIETSIIMKRRSSSCGNVSAPIVVGRERASTAWYSILALWTTAEANLY